MRMCLRRVAVVWVMLLGCASELGGDPPLGGAMPLLLEGPLPADVRAIVYAHCVACHGERPFYGAQMPLTHAEDFHAPAPSDLMRPVLELVRERISDPARPMPPWPYPMLDADAQATLTAWMDSGAPAAHDDEEAVMAASAPSPPASSDPAESGCEQVFELRAHREPIPGDQAPFVVDGPTDRLECFVFRAPWHQPMHALRMEPLIDDAEVVHHVGLGAIEHGTEYTVDGKVSPCRPDQDSISYPLAFFLPGSGPSVMPDDVGLRLPEGEDAYYLLQLHYSAELGRHEDRSGFRICATSALRPHEAQIHWLGSERIFLPPGQTTTTTSGCRVRGHEAVHVVSVMPHMHLLGSAMRIERVALDGQTETLHDAPFDFHEQRIYPTAWTLAPGETLRTSCEHRNTTSAFVTYGAGSAEEMCYAFAVAYPVGGLADRPPGDQQHGCIDR